MWYEYPEEVFKEITDTYRTAKEMMYNYNLDNTHIGYVKIKDLKEYIKDLPDDSYITTVFDDDLKPRVHNTIYLNEEII